MIRVTSICEKWRCLLSKHFGKNLKTASGMYENPIEIDLCNQKESVSCTEVAKIGGIFNFGKFARIASLCVSFLVGALHGYPFQPDFWPNLNFSLEHQIKLVLRLLRDFVSEYHHAKFGCNWTTNKGETEGACAPPPLPAYMVPKDPSLNRVKSGKTKL